MRRARHDLDGGGLPTRRLGAAHSAGLSAMSTNVRTKEASHRDLESQSSAFARAARRSPFRPVLLTLMTGALHLPVWWYGVVREVSRREYGTTDSGRGRAVLSAVPVASLILGLWGLSAWIIFEPLPDNLSFLLFLMLILGIVGYAHVSQTAPLAAERTIGPGTAEVLDPRVFPLRGRLAALGRRPHLLGRAGAGRARARRTDQATADRRSQRARLGRLDAMARPPRAPVSYR